MKKLFTTITILMLALGASAQQIYIHETDEGTCRQNYHSLVTSDGCIIVDEDLFEGENGSTNLAKVQNNGLTITPDTLWFEPMPTGDIPEFVITNETSNDVIIEDIIPEDMGFDENFTTQVMVPQGVYHYDQTRGEYGGYAVNYTFNEIQK